MKRWLPTRAQLRASRWLRPVAHHLEDERLWHMDRGSVARGVGIGLFFGFLVPVAQFLFAITTAIVLRANVAIAAASTLVSNPLTFPPIYWAAYKLGRFILGEPDDEAGALRIESETEALLAQQGFIEGIWASMQAAGAPLMVGLAAMAVTSAVVGFSVVWLLWRPHHAHPRDGNAPPP
ncbi:MAG: DUF2062 domain-containing protein [Methylibium sp.]|uniref:DUF2062 domain-containing protein n=1 Tax=Methylibium sp. TaxID=2067992 RepID=UPI0017DA3C97|nr:DUF2062 domain-containing protein [Methylibium sp.]MBA3598752.1 DUF2062 domain-containing protein [Methylibium sp.]